MSNEYFKTEGLTAQQVQDGLDVLVDGGANAYMGVHCTEWANNFRYAEHAEDWMFAGVDDDNDAVLFDGKGDYGTDAVEITYADLMARKKPESAVNVTLEIEGCDASYDTRVEELEVQLLKTTEELRFMIDKENKRLEDGICCTDLDPPDYLDYETVHEAMKLLEGVWNE